MNLLPRLAVGVALLLAVAGCGAETVGTEPGTSSAAAEPTADHSAADHSATDPSTAGPSGAPTSDAADPGATGPAPPPHRPEKSLPGDARAPGSEASVLTSLRGRLSSGVEPGCVLLESGGRVYLLLGPGLEDVDSIDPAREVVVEGQPQPDAMTTCQQGTPFLVSSVAPA